MKQKNLYTKQLLQEYWDEGKRIHPKTPLYKAIVNDTPFMPSQSTIRQRLWHILNDIKQMPTCKMCDNSVKWDDARPATKQQYRKYCSHKCQHSDSESRNKKNLTELKRYGKGRKMVIEKIKQTNQERYGADFAIQTSQIKTKRQKTVKQKYGVDNVIQHQHIQQKRRQSNLDKFGTEAPAQNDNIKKKIVDTCVERFGSIEQRYKQSSIKSKQTMLQKYGVDHHCQLHITPDNLKKLHNKNWLHHQHITQKRTLTDIAQQLGVRYTTVSFHLNKFNIPIQHNGVSQSVAEQQILELIQQWLPQQQIITNDRTISSPQEIDIVLPQLKIAIEYDGLYWHSELNGKDKNYHLNKTISCNNKQFRLIHVLENEWITKQHIVESRLKSLLHLNQTVHARRCVLMQITTEQSSQFFNDTHIQGNAHAKICYGLFFNDQLVAAMSFCKCRFSKKYQYELTRYSNQLNTTVVGGASKLFSHFVKHHDPKSVVSYCDLRWNTGNMYKQLGFDYSHMSKPNYWYFKPGDMQYKLHHRVGFQKHKLKDKLDYFDPELTEWQNMVNNGYDRIWDCGNSVWVWNK